MDGPCSVYSYTKPFRNSRGHQEARKSTEPRRALKKIADRSDRQCDEREFIVSCRRWGWVEAFKVGLDRAKCALMKICKFGARKGANGRRGE